MRNKSELTESEADDVGCSLVRRLAELRDKEKIRVALVVQYSALDAMEETLHWERSRSRVLGCAEHEHLEIVDTLDALRSAYKQGDLAAYQRLWQMQDNNRVYGHMSAEGNQLIATVVATDLFSPNLSDATRGSAR